MNLKMYKIKGLILLIILQLTALCQIQSQDSLEISQAGLNNRLTTYRDSLDKRFADELDFNWKKGIHVTSFSKDDFNSTYYTSEDKPVGLYKEETWGFIINKETKYPLKLINDDEALWVVTPWQLSMFEFYLKERDELVTNINYQDALIFDLDKRADLSISTITSQQRSLSTLLNTNKSLTDNTIRLWDKSNKNFSVLSDFVGDEKKKIQINLDKEKESNKRLKKALIIVGAVAVIEGGIIYTLVRNR